MDSLLDSLIWGEEASSQRPAGRARKVVWLTRAALAVVALFVLVVVLAP